MKRVRIIPSKSDAHRAYIAAALSHLQRARNKNVAADDESARSESARNEYENSGLFDCVVCDETSEDIEATKRCLKALVDLDDIANLYCGESGSTLRFLLPIVGSLGVRAVFYPQGRLRERPLSPFKEELCSHGMMISSGDKITAEGKLKPGTYNLPGNVSSQFISGLLFALPLLEGVSEIVVEGELESSPYVDMTVETLRKFSISIEDETIFELNQGEPAVKRRIFSIAGNQRYKSPETYIVEGDWSNAAFWFVMGAIGREPIRVEGLRIGSMQGDERVLDAIEAFGVGFRVGAEPGSVTGADSNFYVDVFPSLDNMRGITWDTSETPDMVPALSLLGALSKGETKIINAARLRMKESDRLHTVALTLNNLGANVEELEDGLVIKGISGFKPATLESYGDHRISMMAAAASVAMSEEDVINLVGHKAVKKSYPSFFERMSELELDKKLVLL